MIRIHEATTDLIKKNQHRNSTRQQQTVSKRNVRENKIMIAITAKATDMDLCQSYINNSCSLMVRCSTIIQFRERNANYYYTNLSVKSRLSIFRLTMIMKM